MKLAAHRCAVYEKGAEKVFYLGSMYFARVPAPGEHIYSGTARYRVTEVNQHDMHSDTFDSIATESAVLRVMSDPRATSETL